MADVGTDVLVSHKCPKCRREFDIPLSDVNSKRDVKCPNCGRAIDVSAVRERAMGIYRSQ
jgi:predicted Zn finger-like uncharacterized protein